jgi:uncharacterized protein
MGNPVVHFEIRSNDPDAARTFYGQLFGWTFPPAAMPDYTYVDSGTTTGTIPGGVGPTQGGTPMVTVFVGVPDVIKALDHAQHLGATIVQPATKVPGVTFGMFADPQGNLIGVSSQD